MKNLDSLARRYPSGAPIIDNTDPHGSIKEITAFLPQSQLLDTANRFHTEPEGKTEALGRIRAYLSVLTGSTDQMGVHIKHGMQEGMQFPPTARYPLTARGSLTFSNAKELREFTGDMADGLIAEQIGRLQEEMAVRGEAAAKLVKELSVIAQARIGGALPEEILTPKDLRISVATEIVGQEVFGSIQTTRNGVKEVIRTLMESSDRGIQAAPLARSMKRISELCRDMSTTMESLRLMSDVAIQHENDPSTEKGNHVAGIMDRANEIFRPFIQGSHLITMEQLRRLESFLSETGTYNENISQVIEDGVRAIAQEKAAGNHRNVINIEKAIAFDERVPEFERVTRALDQDLCERAVIIAYAGEHNRMILRNAPVHMVQRAEMESGVAHPGYMTKTLSDPNEAFIPDSYIRELAKPTA